METFGRDVFARDSHLNGNGQNLLGQSHHHVGNYLILLAGTFSSVRTSQ